MRKLPIVYHSLEQVISSLRCSEIAKTSELYQLLKVCSTGSNGILDPSTYMPRSRPMSVIKPKMPIIVMEGLDGSGKTRVSTALVNNLKLDLIHTPPQRIKFLKTFFDEQCEPLRRAYYSLGNYLAAQDILSSQFYNGIVIDRFWPSTAAYAMAHALTANKTELDSSIYQWPVDLLIPDTTYFLIDLKVPLRRIIGLLHDMQHARSCFYDKKGNIANYYNMTHDYGASVFSTIFNGELCILY